MNLVRNPQRPQPGLVQPWPCKTGRTLEEENQLALLIQQGEDAVFLRIYDRYLQSVYGYFARQTKDILLAEDLTSETFIQALNRLRDGVTFLQGCSAWLFGIAHYVSLTWSGRMQSVEWQAISVAELEKAGVGVLATIQLQERTQRIWDLIAQLPEDHQQILILRYKDGLNYVDIALQMKCTVSACRILHGRAMKKLRDKVRLADAGGTVKEIEQLRN